MKKPLVSLFVIALQFAFPSLSLLAHPPSGIVVDQTGNVLVAGSIGPGPLHPGFVWKIDSKNKITSFHKGGAHYLAIDETGQFDRSKLDDLFSKRQTPWLGPVPLAGSNSSLLRADGCPIIVHTDGNIYFAHENAELTCLTPEGRTTSLAGNNTAGMMKKFGGIKGLASGPDGMIYVACPSTVLKLNPAGAIQTITRSITLKDCDKDPRDTMTEPGLRGLAVDSQGVVFAAATGCRCVVKIGLDGKIATVLKAESPWSPTGVTVHGDDVYVLEYANANSDKNEDWQPRVRKLDRDGKPTTLATLSKEWN